MVQNTKPESESIESLESMTEYLGWSEEALADLESFLSATTPKRSTQKIKIVKLEA